MKTKSFKIARLFPAGIFALFLAASCVDESYSPATGTGGKEKDVTFTLTLPGHSSGGSTYALSGQDEEDVKSVEVLLFASGGDYVETRTVASAAVTGSGSTKTFTVKIPEGTYSSLVVLANSYNIVFDAGLSTSDTKDSALKKLYVTNTGKWVTNSASGSYKAIPMWGELGSTTIDRSTSSAPHLLQLTRMLAKASVSLVTPEAINNFKLKTINVYNYYNKGSVAPATADWNVGLGTASVPQGAAKPAATTPYTTLLYSGSEITTANIASFNEIYLFESDNNLQSDLLHRTCLVLGGTYTGDGKTYYYRADFVKNTSGTDTYLNILRNHHYKFNVTAISGPGYKNPDEAFAARPFNIEATVVAWNDAEIKNVGTDGQYMLGVSQMEYDLATDGYTLADSNNKLAITTDYPGGWAISSIIDDATGIEAEWLSVSPEESSGGTGKKTISLLLNPNDSEGSRSAKVAVTAGTITIVVKVNQSDVPNLGLNIKNSNGKEITELAFYTAVGIVPDAQEFTVTWAPKNRECLILSNTIGSHPFDYGLGIKWGADGYTETDSKGLGTQVFAIAPPAISSDEVKDNPFLEKVSKVDFTITNGISYMSKSIFFRQTNYDLIPSGYKDLFPLDGEHSFTVKANTTWTAKIENNSNTDVTINILTPNSNGNTSGEAFRFTLTYTGSAIATAGTFDVVFTNATGKFSERRCAIMWANGTVWAGSNIYWDNLKKTLVFDDYGVTTHEKYQGVFFTWGSLWGISPSGNWSTSTPVYKLTAPYTYTKSSVAYWGTVIPTYFDPADDSRDSKFLTEKVHPTNKLNDKGDICKYLTEQAGGRLYDKKWRMPTANEFKSLATESFDSSLFVSASNSNDYKWEGATWSTTISTVSDDGTTPISNGIRKSLAIGTPFFPASNYRSYNYGAISDFTGKLGNYWSASGSSSNTVRYLMSFGSSDVNFLSSQNGSAAATPVRCVVDESKE